MHWRHSLELSTVMTPGRTAPNPLPSTDVRRLADAFPHPALLVSSDGGCLHANPRWTELVPEEGEAERFGWLERLDTGSRAKVLEHFGNPHTRRRPFTLDHELVARGGAVTRKRYVTTITPVEQGELEPSFWLVTMDSESEDRSRAYEKTRRVLSSITEGFFVLDSEFRFVEANEAAIRMVFRMPSSELVGRGFWDIFPQGRTSEFYAEYRRAMETGQPVHFEAKSQIVDRWFEAHAHPIDGHLEVYIRDVTARKRAEEALRASERRLQALLDIAPVGIGVATDPDCRTISANRAFEEMLGLPRGANASLSSPASDGLPFRVLKDGLDVPPYELPMEQTSRTGEPVVGERLEIRRADGRSITILGAAAPLFDDSGKLSGSVAAFMDITREKEAEDLLRETDRRKDEFLAMLAHEIRNPVAAIVNSLQVWRLSGGPSARERQAFEILERQSEQLSRLIDDLLDVSRIALGKVELRKEPIELGLVLRRSADSASSLIGSRNHTLSMDITDVAGFRIDADPARLEQIFVNLLSNAAKYSPPGGRIRIEAEPDGTDLVVRVIDNGPGIAPELQSKIFELFAQVERSNDQARAGLGIGLTVVKRLVELHGGSAAVRNREGGGSEFSVRLPGAEMHDADASRSDRTSETLRVDDAAPSNATHRVLVVDDNRDLAKMIEILLRASGHDVRLAHDGVAGLEAAREYRPGVILLDLGLPRMTGFEVARELRRDPGFQRTLIIAVSGYGQSEDQRHAIESGFDAHLIKPIDPEALAELFRQHGAS